MSNKKPNGLGDPLAAYWFYIVYQHRNSAQRKVILQARSTLTKMRTYSTRNKSTTFLSFPPRRSSFLKKL